MSERGRGRERAKKEVDRSRREREKEGEERHLKPLSVRAWECLTERELRST